MALIGPLLSPAMTTGASAAGGFLTNTAPYITVTDPANGSVRAIITSGDTIGDYMFAKFPTAYARTQTARGR